MAQILRHPVPQCSPARQGPARGFNMALSGVVINPTLDLVWDTEGRETILPEEPDMVRESGLPVRPRLRLPVAPRAWRRSCYDVDSNAEVSAWVARAHLPARIRPPARHALRRSSFRALRSAGGSSRRARVPCGHTWTPGEPKPLPPGSRYRRQWTSSPADGSSCGPLRWPRAWAPSRPQVVLRPSECCPCSWWKGRTSADR